MPNFLSIPRELRDEIYNWSLLTPLSDQPLTARVARKRNRTKDGKGPEFYTRYNQPYHHPVLESSDPIVGYVWGEEPVHYPERTPLPPVQPLLATCSQVRTELKQALFRMYNGKLRYKIDLAACNDEGHLYPTWVSLPMFAKHVDVLDVTLRVREGKTSSVCSSIQSANDDWRRAGDNFSGGLACLQRFLERGVHFLSKKKRDHITVDLLAVEIDAKQSMGHPMHRDECVRMVEMVADELEEWMLGKDLPMKTYKDLYDREDDQFRYLAGRIKRLSLSTCGVVIRDWDIGKMVQRRDEQMIETKKRWDERVTEIDGNYKWAMANFPNDI